ncbi:UNVERIFIED_ORG: hypothetical protein GCAPEGMB_00235 [Vibrio phage V07]
MNIKAGQIVVSTATSHKSVGKNGEYGLVMHANNTLAIVYWPNAGRCVKQFFKNATISRVDFPDSYRVDINSDEARAAYVKYKADIADKVKAKKANSAPTVKLGTADNVLDVVNTEMGAVSAIMSDVQYSPLQEAVIMNNLMKLVERCRVKFGMKELMLMGDGVDKAEETMQSINDIRAKVETLGASLEDLLKL